MACFVTSMASSMRALAGGMHVRVEGNGDAVGVQAASGGDPSGVEEAGTNEDAARPWVSRLAVVVCIASS